MTSAVLLAVCFGLGVLARRSSAVPPQAPQVINTWVLYVSLPALVIHALHDVTLDAGALTAAGVLWVNFCLAAGLGLLAVTRGWLPRDVAGGLALCAGLGNTAFVGLPLLEALGGASTTGPAILIDQLGSFLALSFFAVPFATVMGGHGAKLSMLVKRLVTFPPFIALVVVALTRSLDYPHVVDALLERLASMLTPLALASVGYQLDLSRVRGQWHHVAVGLGFKLVVAPAVMLMFLWLVRRPLGEVERIGVAQAAMAPMTMAGVLATEHQLAPNLCAAVIAVGVPLSFLTVFLWWGAL